MGGRNCGRVGGGSRDDRQDRSVDDAYAADAEDPPEESTTAPSSGARPHPARDAGVVVLADFREKRRIEFGIAQIVQRGRGHGADDAAAGDGGERSRMRVAEGVPRTGA